MNMRVLLVFMVKNVVSYVPPYIHIKIILGWRIHDGCIYIFQFSTLVLESSIT